MADKRCLYSVQYYHNIIISNQYFIKIHLERSHWFFLWVFPVKFIAGSGLFFHVADEILKSFIQDKSILIRLKDSHIPVIFNLPKHIIDTFHIPYFIARYMIVKFQYLLTNY